MDGVGGRDDVRRALARTADETTAAACVGGRSEVYGRDGVIALSHSLRTDTLTRPSRRPIPSASRPPPVVPGKLLVARGGGVLLIVRAAPPRRSRARPRGTGNAPKPGR